MIVHLLQRRLNHFFTILINQNGFLMIPQKKWPRTQDLEKIYKINHAAFIAKRSVYENLEIGLV